MVFCCGETEKEKKGRLVDNLHAVPPRSQTAPARPQTAPATTSRIYDPYFFTRRWVALIRSVESAPSYSQHCSILREGEAAALAKELNEFWMARARAADSGASTERIAEKAQLMCQDWMGQVRSCNTSLSPKVLSATYIMKTAMRMCHDRGNTAVQVSPTTPVTKDFSSKLWETDSLAPPPSFGKTAPSEATPFFRGPPSPSDSSPLSPGEVAFGFSPSPRERHREETVVPALLHSTANPSGTLLPPAVHLGHPYPHPLHANPIAFLPLEQGPTTPPPLPIVEMPATVIQERSVIAEHHHIHEVPVAVEQSHHPKAYVSQTAKLITKKEAKERYGEGYVKTLEQQQRGQGGDSCSLM